MIRKLKLFLCLRNFSIIKIMNTSCFVQFSKIKLKLLEEKKIDVNDDESIMELLLKSWLASLRLALIWKLRIILEYIWRRVVISVLMNSLTWNISLNLLLTERFHRSVRLLFAAVNINGKTHFRKRRSAHKSPSCNSPANIELERNFVERCSEINVF